MSEVPEARRHHPPLQGRRGPAGSVQRAEHELARRRDRGAGRARRGAGKSSLLHIAGLLEAPTSGEIIIEGVATSALDDGAKTRIRRDTIGFVYQAHHLLPEFDAPENVILPQMIAGTAARPRPRRRPSACWACWAWASG